MGPRANINKWFIRGRGVQGWDLERTLIYGLSEDEGLQGEGGVISSVPPKKAWHLRLQQCPETFT